MAKDWESLEVAKEVRNLAKEVIALPARFPDEERNYLAAKIRSSSASVMKNIAEGHDRYFYKETINFLYFSRGSTCETQSHLYVAPDRNYIFKINLMSSIKNQNPWKN